MINQVVSGKRPIMRYSVVLSSAPFLEQKAYLDDGQRQKLLPGANTIVGIQKKGDENYRFISWINNPTLSENGKFIIEISIERIVCTTCRTSICMSAVVVSNGSEELDTSRLKVCVNDNVAYLCCSDACKTVLETNPLPYIG